jgi:hypothetical protein
VNETAHPSWLNGVTPGAVRFSRSSANYEETVAFYRDVVDLPILDTFADSFGEDGTIFGMPGVRTHLEIVRSRDHAFIIDPLDQIVFYVSGAAAMDEATARLRASGTSLDASPHPYWQARGAVVYLDPDGRRVVFAPWVFGLEPEPGTPNPQR